MKFLNLLYGSRVATIADSMGLSRVSLVDLGEQWTFVRIAELKKVSLSQLIYFTFVGNCKYASIFGRLLQVTAFWWKEQQQGGFA